MHSYHNKVLKHAYYGIICLQIPFFLQCNLLGNEQYTCVVEWLTKFYCVFELEAAQVLSQQHRCTSLTNMEINSLLHSTGNFSQPCIVLQCIVRIVFLIAEEYFVSVTSTPTNEANDGE